jgi:hypothetical protein
VLHFFESGEPIANMLEGVFLHELHAILPREGADFIAVPAFADGGADGFVEEKKILRLGHHYDQLVAKRF